MLTDAERKVLRVIANYSAGRRRMPSLLELGRKTGKSRETTSWTLAELAKDGYVQGEYLDIMWRWGRNGTHFIRDINN
ncbi:hypothetical protein Elgi_15030 [Paenibacillus elgii]|uniref:hypothetical protein n=1 Tax=Paenibacillus elgii TaxID=189691 RepID=UPI002D7D8826|nr:hypothetical protein Elgi_15030 [Paenibacillus elgii]